MSNDAAWRGALSQSAPPSAIYVGPDAALRLSAYSSLAGVRLTVEARLVGMDGIVQTVKTELEPTSDRIVSRAIAGMAEGWLLGGHVRPTVGSPRRGQVFARVELVRGRSGDVQPIQMLGQGYVSETSWIGWPHGTIEDSTSGPGLLRVVTGTDPAAGAESSETVPANARWRLLAAKYVLVTDATVASRAPVFIIDDGTKTVVRAVSPATIPASNNVDINVGDYGYCASVLGLHYVTIPGSELLLQGGMRIRTSTGSFQVGDNWAAPSFLVEEWIED